MPRGLPANRRRKRSFDLGSFSPQAIDEVWDAIQALRIKLPQLVKFARMATGRPDMVVEITTGAPHTLGNKVFIRPPLGLGSKYEHDRSNCGHRDFSGTQICKACQVREVIDFYLFHELAHVIGGTQNKVTFREHRRAAREAARLHPEGCAHHVQVFERLDFIKVHGSDAMSLGQVFNPFLPTIINVLEDARVNEMTFQTRPGMRIVFEMNTEQLLTEGTEVSLGERRPWSDAPLDSQFMVGLQIRASGASYQGAFHEDVINALADSKLTRLCERATQVENVYEIFMLSLEVHERAQQLGYCKLDPCEPAPPPPDIGSLGNPGGEEKTQGESGEGESGEGSSPGVQLDGESAGPEDSDSPSSRDASPASPSVERSDADESDGPGDEEEIDGAGNSPVREPDSGLDNAGVDDPDEKSGGSDSDGDEQGELGSGETGSGKESNSESEGSESGEEVNAASECGKVQDAGNDGESDASANPSDDAGVSGPGNEGAAFDGGVGAASDGGVPASEGETRDSGSEQVGPGDGEVSSESQRGSDGVEAGGSQDGQSDSDVSGDGDDEGDSEAEVEIEGEDDHTEALDPWDVLIPERPDAEGAPFDTPSGPVEPSPADLGQHGTPEETARALGKFLMHGYHDKESDIHTPGLLDEMADGDLDRMIGIPGDADYDQLMENLIDLALSQVHVFDGPSVNVATTEVATFPTRGIRWDVKSATQSLGVDQSELPRLFAPPESLIGQVLLHARRVFDNNKRSSLDRNRKSGKINTKVLGRRAPTGDDRLFAKKVTPSKKSYFVVLGGDASGSTDRLERSPKIKRCLHAQGDLLARLGIDWAGYMHSAYGASLHNWDASAGWSGMLWNYLLPYKAENDAWNDAAKERLACIMPVSQNLDGHTLEAYRKIAMKHQATDRVVMYYTDGEFPAINAEEERTIIDRELILYKQHRIKLVCVGIQTDSPARLGIPTVRVDSDEDIVKVIEFLDKILSE